MRHTALITLLCLGAYRAEASPPVAAPTSSPVGTSLVEEMGWGLILNQWQPGLQSLQRLLSAPGAPANFVQWIGLGFWPDAPESPARKIMQDFLQSPEKLGIDGAAAVAFSLDLNSGVVLVEAALANPEQTAQRLAAAGQSGTRAKQPIWVIDETKAWPLSCTMRRDRLQCQVGVSSGEDPLEPLARLIGSRPVNWLSKTSSVAVATAYVRPQSMLRRAAGNPRSLLTKASGVHSIDQARRMRRMKARRMGQWAKRVPAMQLELREGNNGWIVAGGAQLSTRASQHLAAATEAGAPNRSIAQWTKTPSLLSASIRLSPDAVVRAAAAMGVKLHGARPTGHAGLLVFGVDTECPEARSPIDGRWPSFFPTAVAIHVDADKEAQPPQADLDGWQAELRSPFLLLSRGAGAHAAGLRRMNVKTDATEPADTFVRMTMDIAAVEAALSAAYVRPDHRSELVELHQTYEMLRPWLAAWSQLTLRARHDPAQRVVWMHATLRD